jgi:hypothetical protein
MRKIWYAYNALGVAVPESESISVSVTEGVAAFLLLRFVSAGHP